MNTPNCKCSNCNKKLYRKPFLVDKHKIHFCNRDCHNEFQRKTVGTAKEYICNNCGTKVIKTKNQRRNSKTGLCFCSNKCKNKFIAKSRRWSENPYSHRSRRPRLINASNKVCQKCGYGDHIELLDIHHFDGNHSNNEWKNLRVLCVRCHLEHHRLGVEIKVPILINE